MSAHLPAVGELAEAGADDEGGKRRLVAFVLHLDRVVLAMDVPVMRRRP
jgi:hypothetical protein